MNQTTPSDPGSAPTSPSTAVDPDLLFVFTGSEIGSGPADLGARLTEIFLKMLADAERRPAKILFLNHGVLLTTEGTPVLESLKRLEKGGTRLVSCITCLTYFDRMDRIVVGEAGDMKGTVADLTTFPKVVRV